MSKITEKAVEILKKHGCQENAYAGVCVPEIVSDLRSVSEDCSPYGTESIAKEIRRIGDAARDAAEKERKEKANYIAVWDCNTGSFCDGQAYETLEEAKDACIACFISWMESMMDEPADEWNRMIDEDMCYVQKRITEEERSEYKSSDIMECEDGLYVDCYYFPDNELESIGWKKI